MKKADLNMNWAGVRSNTGPGTVPGSTYNGGMCECGHSAIAHNAQGHFQRGSWQCWKGKWARTKRKPLQFLLTALPCGWHEFKRVVNIKTKTGEHRNGKSV